MFTDQQKAALDAPLSQKNVKTRQQAGRTLSYIEGWQTISEANRIFGFDNWSRATVEIKCVAERERKIGRAPNDKDGWGVSYIARVRITVGDIIREGVGSGHGIDVDLGLAHESAIKESETDATKRALMTFGNPFGLALYDKEQTNVSHTPSSDEMMFADRSLSVAAEKGLSALKAAWTKLSPEVREAMGGTAPDRFKKIAQQKDGAAA